MHRHIYRYTHIHTSIFFSEYHSLKYIKFRQCLYGNIEVGHTIHEDGHSNAISQHTDIRYDTIICYLYVLLITFYDVLFLSKKCHNFVFFFLWDKKWIKKEKKQKKAKEISKNFILQNSNKLYQIKSSLLSSDWTGKKEKKKVFTSSFYKSIE